MVTARRVVLNDETRPCLVSRASSRLPSAWLGASAGLPLAPVFA
jgi:hypothetical protein